MYQAQFVTLHTLHLNIVVNTHWRVFHHIRRKGRVQHCRIKSKQENGQTKYYLVDQVTFDSLYSLINFYQTHPLKSMNFELTLTDAIPQVIN